MTARVQMIPERGAVPALSLVLARFRLRARRRAAWLQHLWGLEEPPVSNAAITPGEVETILSAGDSRAAEEEWILADDAMQECNAELLAVEEILAGDTSSRYARFKRIFGLNAREQDLFEACLAVSMEPALSRVCAYVQDHVARGYMTEELASRLYGFEPGHTWNSESALGRWELLSAHDPGIGEAPALVCDPQIRAWLEGRPAHPDLLAGAMEYVEAHAPLPSWPVSATLEEIRRCLQSNEANHLRVLLEGGPGSGRHTFAAVLCADLQMPLLAVDADQIDDAHWRRACMLAERQAYLEGAALAWHGEALARRTWPSAVVPFPLQFVILNPGQEAPRVTGSTDYRVRLPRPDLTERIGLWRKHVPASAAWPPAEFEALASRYKVEPGEIAAIGRHAVSSAKDAAGLLRESGRGRLGNLAQLLACPFTWDDLVAPAPLRDALEDIAFEATHRIAFWEQAAPRRLFPQGQGLVALFSGPPGTGKTMSAQVIAASLGLDLFRVDLSAVVSKWVGETSQNFERILSRAADLHAIILFDECDAIFSKRASEIRDAQDKFANTDSAYLLQAIESYPGIALLATNLKGNVDPAFIRRLRYVLEFVKPDAAQRLEIWRKVVGALATSDRAAALDGELRVLAEAVEATGAQIKYAILTAIFRAQREGMALGMRHLFRGLERELGKEGRSLSARDRERIISHAK
jgi:adenylate kinase family enzyme